MKFGQEEIKKMSMRHKAFIFDYDAFIQELADILENALAINQGNELITFIENNLSSLKDPDEGEALDSSWKEIIEIEDISQYGDFAITKYYNPQCDIGLGYDWLPLHNMLFNELDKNVSPLLGKVFGISGNYFDPGKMGSYFQSLEQVNQNWELLNLLLNEKNEYLPSLVLAMKMLSNALDLQKGLYITF
ncbi:MAG: hypothetical protein V7K94_16170 [Nostoc sp.]|uniref:hypothetical protein n=1 Tax=Nostoc sp. TaxID=1180 RepID=UPI002FF5E202